MADFKKEFVTATLVALEPTKYENKKKATSQRPDLQLDVKYNIKVKDATDPDLGTTWGTYNIPVKTDLCCGPNGAVAVGERFNFEVVKSPGDPAKNHPKWWVTVWAVRPSVADGAPAAKEPADPYEGASGPREEGLKKVGVPVSSGPLPEDQKNERIVRTSALYTLAPVLAAPPTPTGSHAIDRLAKRWGVDGDQALLDLLVGYIKTGGLNLQ